MAVIWHWKLRIIIMTTCGAINDDKIGIRKTPCVQWWCGWYFVNNVSADGLASASQHQETQWWLSCIKPTFESYFIYKHIRFLTSVWGLLLSGLYCIGYPCVCVNQVMLNLMRKYWYEHICVFISFLDLKHRRSVIFILCEDDDIPIPHTVNMMTALIARFMGPKWGPSGADRTQVGPMLAPWTLLSGWWWSSNARS